ncbi:hypothetical protein SAMN05428952_104022 [Nitrosomonas sp. Nm132]|jgi:hypothetical protein|nr:hypothetical protein SAMN05428952_104022 [Nitrosomonas sp. Nm132]
MKSGDASMQASKNSQTLFLALIFLLFDQPIGKAADSSKQEA